MRRPIYCSVHSNLVRRRPAGARKSAICVAAVCSAIVLSGCGATLNKDGQFSPVADAGAAPAMGLSTGASTIGHGTGAKGGPITTGSVALDPVASHEAAKLTEASDPKSNAYKIGPSDVLEVSVYKVPDLSRTVQVADGGTINLPLVGEIPAAGRTSQEIERDLAKRLGAKYLQSPQVNVFVKEFNSQRVTIDGSVKKPGVYPIRGGATLLQIIATAEGFTESASTEVAIFRMTDGKRTAAKFDVDDIRSGKITDPQVLEGDAIIVSDSTMKSTYQGILKVLPTAGIFAAFI